MSLFFQGRAAPGFDPAYRVVLRTTAENEEAGFRCIIAPIDLLIDWGDGQQSAVTDIDDPALEHTYASPGDHSASVTGTAPRIQWGASNGAAWVEIQNWGALGLTNCASMFAGASNLIITATDAGDFSAVTIMASMFQSTTPASPRCDLWDVSSNTSLLSFGLNSSILVFPGQTSGTVMKPTRIDRAFENCVNFNGDFSTCDMSSCNNLANACLNVGMSQANVDIYLAQCVAGGKSGKATTIDGANCAAPSAAGYADKSILEGRGWTVTTN